MWRDNGLWFTLNHALLMVSREAQGREASLSAGVIDSQSAKATESGGPRGYDTGKKVKGRKRHILTDTEGNLVHAVVHTADIQDRDGAPLVLREIIKRFPWLRHIFADGGYAGDKLKDAPRSIGKWTIEIIKRTNVGQRLRSSAPAVGRRTHLGLAQSQLPSGQGLRASHRLGDGRINHQDSR